MQSISKPVKVCWCALIRVQECIEEQVFQLNNCGQMEQCGDSLVHSSSGNMFKNKHHKLETETRLRRGTNYHL